MNYIVNTPLVKVFKSSNGYEMHITAKNGAIIEHEPFPSTLEGMVAAISLSAEICAGKFFLKSVLQTPDSFHKTKLIGKG
jgi:hypothetical protein